MQKMEKMEGMMTKSISSTTQPMHAVEPWHNDIQYTHLDTDEQNPLKKRLYL